MKPPSGGPSTGPISAGTVTQAMASISDALVDAAHEHEPCRPASSSRRRCLARCGRRRSAQRGRERAADRPDDKDRDRRPEHLARAEAVGGPSARGDEDGEREQIGRNASLSASGLVCRSAAIAGSDVAITVESMFSMNKATATMSGTRRSRLMENAQLPCRFVIPDGELRSEPIRATRYPPHSW